MKRLIAIPVLLVLVVAYWTVAKADHHETDAIKAAIQEIFAAWDAGDAEAAAKHNHSSGGSNFYGGAGLLSLFNTAGLQAWFDAGNKVNNRPIRHLDVKVYGDAAVSTGYWRGTTTNPSGESQSTTWRGSSFWVKEDGIWKVVHGHTSPLIIEPPDDDDDGDDDDDDDDD